MSAPNKQALLDALLARLTEEFERAKAQALDAAEGATHEDNKAEGDKDMRSTEASYIARGHAQRTAQLEQAISRLSHLALVSFGDGDAIQNTALVELRAVPARGATTTSGPARTKTSLWYLLLPVAGGERIPFGETVVQSLTPSSPLGEALIGLSVGDEAEVESPQGSRVYEIVSVA